MRNAYAGIFHIKMYLAHAGRTTIPQLDAAFFRKLVGIVQEVGEYLCQSHGIYIHLHIFGREILEELQRRLDKQAMRLIDVIEQLAHTLPLKDEREVTRLDARQFQHIAHQFQQQFGIGVDNVHKLLPLFVGELRLVSQHVREADNGIERSAYFVTHVIEERLFQFGLLRKLAGFYQLLLVVFQFLDVLQQSGYDGCVSGGVDGIVAELPPLELAGEVTAVLSLVVRTFVP